MQGPLLAVSQSPAPSRVKELGWLLGSTNKAPAQQRLPISEPSPPTPQLEPAEMKAPPGGSSFASCITMTFPTREMGIGALPGFPSSGATGMVSCPGAVSSHVGEKLGRSVPGPVGLEESEVGRGELGGLLTGWGGPSGCAPGTWGLREPTHPAKDLQVITH